MKSDKYFENMGLIRKRIAQQVEDNYSKFKLVFANGKRTTKFIEPNKVHPDADGYETIDSIFTWTDKMLEVFVESVSGCETVMDFFETAEIYAISNREVLLMLNPKTEYKSLFWGSSKGNVKSIMTLMSNYVGRVNQSKRGENKPFLFVLNIL